MGRSWSEFLSNLIYCYCTWETTRFFFVYMSIYSRPPHYQDCRLYSSLAQWAYSDFRHAGLLVSIVELASVLECLSNDCSHQERRGVKGCDGDGVENLRLLQSLELLFSVAQNLLQEGLLPGIKLQDFYPIQDLIHQSDTAIHELHLNLLLTRHRGFYSVLFEKDRMQSWNWGTVDRQLADHRIHAFVNMGLTPLITAVVVFLNITELV